MGNFCQTCGARRNPEARFCTSCGAASGAQVADHAGYAPPRRPWGLWFAGAGGALALIAGVAVATGQGLPFGERSADTDGDGIVSESELRAELAAIPRIETGQWQVSIEGRQAGQQARRETHEMDVVQGHPFELIWSQDKYDRKSEKLISELIAMCTVNQLTINGSIFSGNADCDERGDKFHMAIDGSINSRSLYFNAQVKGIVGDGANMKISATKIL